MKMIRICPRLIHGRWTWRAFGPTSTVLARSKRTFATQHEAIADGERALRRIVGVGAIRPAKAVLV